MEYILVYRSVLYVHRPDIYSPYGGHMYQPLYVSTSQVTLLSNHSLKAHTIGDLIDSS